ncbi:NPP1 protein [Phytophthora cinnamomi]|uniref:NPP1 protein n=1 Tax=Phytophthora cinnamomi TaxID=4785 RepID=UPI003559F981|nr:NPP1 protein [Phytophthora cinnamomi]
MEDAVSHFHPEMSPSKRPNKKRQYYAWKAVRATIEAKCLSGFRLHCRDRSRGMGATLPPTAEEQLVEWINSLRADGVPVTALMLKLQALEFFRECQLTHGAFAATWSWRKHFLRRHKLSIRRRTRAGQTTPDDAATKAAEFSVIVRDKMKELKISKVYNADQTGVNYEYVPTQTVSPLGAKTVWVRCAGKTKERVTVMLLGDNEGTKLDPFLIFKTKPSKISETARENTATRHGFGRKLWSELGPLQHGVQIYGNDTAWWNSELSIAFLSYHFLHRPNMHEPVLLLWDGFSGHWRTDVLMFARLLNVELHKVPPGYTYVCQPADVAWNQPFKVRLRHEWVEFLVAQVRAAGAAVAFKMLPPTRTELVMWIKDAWADLSSTTIKAGFRKAKIETSLQPEQPLSLPAPPCTVPSLNAMVMLLRKHEVTTETIDATRDIEEDYEEAIV